MAKTKEKTGEEKAARGILLKPVTSEKAVKLIEIDNVLIFSVSRRETKQSIRKEFEKIFSVKVDKINTLSRGNQKYAYIKIKKEFPAIDIATKLGMI
jgi:large subunit ribosomal protein L23